MSAITTHVLDTSAGRPAAGVRVRLEQEGKESDWMPLADGSTDDKGRLSLETNVSMATGNYRLVFAVGAYFADSGVETFYPQVTVTFCVRDAAQHYHVPLLVSPHGYSTYRGS